METLTVATYSDPRSNPTPQDDPDEVKRLAAEGQSQTRRRHQMAGPTLVERPCVTAYADTARRCLYARCRHVDEQ